MIYGLTGASCSGKTTLGIQLSQKLGIPFVPTKITELASELKLPSPVSNLNLMERMNVQFRLMHGMKIFLDNLTTPCIIDRTPIDLIAYMFAEINMHSLADKPAGIDDCLVDFYHSCIELTTKHISRLYCLDYLTNYELDTKRPPAGEAYQLHCQLLIKGAMSQLSFEGVVAKCLTPDTPLEERVELIYRDITEDIASRLLAEAKLKTLN